MNVRLPVRVLIFYALPAFPVALLGLPLYIYLPTFYAQQLGLGVTLVGALLLFARLFDMVTDPLIGLLSDRLGRRKTPIIAGALLLPAAFYALAHPARGAGALWLLGFSLLVYTGWSLLNIPYLALNAELTPHYHDKTRLAAARETGAILGVVTALVLPYALSVAEDAESTLRLLGNLLLFTSPILTLLTWWGLREPPRHHLKRPALFTALGTIRRRHDATLRLMAAYLLNNIANALPATLFLFFVSLVLHSAERTGLLLVLYFLSGLLALPLWTLLARRIGKRRSWMFSMLLASAAFVFVPFLEAGDLLFFTLICLVSGLSLGADMALPAAIQSDIVHAAQTQDETIGGIYFGLWSMLTKLALALAVGIAFTLLGLAGFEPEAPTPGALSVLALLYGALPVILKLAALVLLLRYREANDTAATPMK